MYKMVVSGFDNILIDSDYAVPLSTVLTLDEIRRKNIKFTVATGRDMNFVRDYVKDVNFIDYIVACNGSYVYDVIHEEVIYKKALSKTNIKKIIDKYRGPKTKIYLYTDNSKCYLNDLEEETDDIIIRNLDDFLKSNQIYKMEIYGKTKKYTKEILTDIASFNISANLKITYDDTFLEIVNKNIDKLTGVKKVLKKEKIKLNEVVFFAHDEKDTNLASEAGYTVSMKNAKTSIKKISKKKTNDCNHKGVENALKEIFDVR